MDCILRDTELKEDMHSLKIGGRNITKLCYDKNTTPLAENTNAKIIKSKSKVKK